MEEPDALTPLDPDFIKLLRADGAIRSLALLAIAALIEAQMPIPTGLALIPALGIAVWAVLVGPARRYQRWSYAFGKDRLRVTRGLMFHHDTVVPLGRVQHIDVNQGPLMRRWGLAMLTVRTAGNHSASVSLPGLKLAQAEAMREAIREHIRLGQG